MRVHQALDGIPGTLWRMVAFARHRLLMLDYDGTLAPFAVERDRAVPMAGAPQLLHRIASSTRTSVAIVSGRPLEEVEGLLGALPAVFVGEHGWEQRDAGGEIVRRPLDASVEATIEAAESAARSAGWGDHLERKRSAVVLHTRGLPDSRARELQEGCLQAWTRLANRSVALDLIDGGVEMRARARNKGTVVSSLLSQSPPGTLGVFVGDDVTDEDAFEAVRDRGFGVRVGRSESPTIAEGRLPSCEAVPEFLEEWLRVADGRECDSD